MFCAKCGAEINDEAVICPNCGCATKREETAETPDAPINPLCLVGFLLSVASPCFSFFGLLFAAIPYIYALSLIMTLFGICLATGGTVVSSIGFRAVARNGQRLKGLGLAGIIVGGVSILLSIIWLITGVVWQLSLVPAA